jgi:hypothetical protein
MRDVVKGPPPIQIEAGIERIKGDELLHQGYTVGRAGVMHYDQVTHRGTLRSYDIAEQDAFLEVFLKKVHANTGIERQPNLYGR